MFGVCCLVATAMLRVTGRRVFVAVIHGSFGGTFLVLEKQQVTRITT